MKKKILLLSLVLVLALSMASFAGAQDSGRTAITVENAANLELLQRISRGSADHAQFTPDGSTILVGGTLGIWQYDVTDLGTTTEPPLLAFTGEIVDFALSPDGSLLVTYDSTVGELELYSYPAMELIGTYDPEVTPSRLSFSPDNTMVAINGGSRGLEVVSAENGELIAAFDASLQSEVPAIFSPDSTTVAAVNRSNAIQLWEVAQGAQPTIYVAAPATVNDIAFSADGTQLLSSSSALIALDVAEGGEVLNVDSDGEGNALRGLNAFAVSPDGSQIYTGENSTIRIWNAADGTETNTIELETGSIDQITFSPDGSSYLVRLTDQSMPVMLFDTADNTVIASIVGHSATMNAIDFSPDNNVLALADNDGFLYLWDTNTAGEITEAIKVEDGTTFGIANTENIAFSSDNSTLAALDSFGVFLRDPQTGELLFELSPGGIAFDAVFSPDDTMIAYISSQGLWVYEVATGTELFSYQEANNWMQGVAWSPDQTMLAIASMDHVVRVFVVGE